MAAADIECRLLEVTVISARDLMDVRQFFTMNPYVVVILSGDERHKKKQRTHVHEDGGTSPRWDHALAHPFTVDVAAARTGRLTLELEIKTERSLGDRDVGRVDVPVGQLLEQGGDGQPREMIYAVSTGGVLEFSYKFGKAFTEHRTAPHEPPENQKPPGGPGAGLRFGMMIGSAFSNFCSDGADT